MVEGGSLQHGHGATWGSGRRGHWPPCGRQDPLSGRNSRLRSSSRPWAGMGAAGRWRAEAKVIADRRSAGQRGTCIPPRPPLRDGEAGAQAGHVHLPRTPARLWPDPGTPTLCWDRVFPGPPGEALQEDGAGGGTSEQLAWPKKRGSLQRHRKDDTTGTGRPRRPGVEGRPGAQELEPRGRKTSEEPGGGGAGAPC